MNEDAKISNVLLKNCFSTTRLLYAANTDLLMSNIMVKTASFAFRDIKFFQRSLNVNFEKCKIFWKWCIGHKLLIIFYVKFNNAQAYLFSIKEKYLGAPQKSWVTLHKQNYFKLITKETIWLQFSLKSFSIPSGLTKLWKNYASCVYFKTFFWCINNFSVWWWYLHTLQSMVSWRLSLLRQWWRKKWICYERIWKNMVRIIQKTHRQKVEFWTIWWRSLTRCSISVGDV